ncbi:Ig-like domain-containing protein [Salinibacterium sp. ZJ70]|uniref:Ig-like domain-containing protein n=1 Tax=Salinibacterium sp. ZJ70 TaxID=2708084 RepID=UPI00141E1AE4|nr:Ig-like domain-containing protein [Salinibacterium sp. ZJ70]
MLRPALTVLAAVVLTVLSVGAASPALAAPPTTTTYSYTVTGSSPMTSRYPSYERDCSLPINWSNRSRNYESLTASVSVTGDYTFTDTLGGGSDGYIAVFEGTFDNSDVSNCLIAIDTSGTVTLFAGTTYTIVGAGREGWLGTFTWSVTGPGEFATPVKISSSISLGAAATTLTDGEELVLDAAVAAATPDLDLTGTVEFFAGDTILGVSAVPPSGSAASFRTRLAAGVHSIVAVYSGTAAVHQAQSDAVEITVAGAPVAVEPTPAPAALELAATGPESSIGLGAAGGIAALILGSTMLARRRQIQA